MGGDVVCAFQNRQKQEVFAEAYMDVFTAFWKYVDNIANGRGSG